MTRHDDFSLRSAAYSPSVLILRAAVTVVLLGVLTGACGSDPEGGPAGGPPGGRGGGMGVPVEVVELAPKPIEELVEFVGVLRSRRSSVIQPQAEGFITRIVVTAGEPVAARAPLFEIDASAQQAAVASLESLRLAREADVAFARQQANRAAALLDVGAVSQQEQDLAASQLRSAEAQLGSIQEQIRQQQAELAFYTVLAPTAGVVGDIPVRPGERVSKTTVLTTIDDNAGLEVYVNVPVEQASRLRIGLPVRLVDDDGQTLVTQYVSFIAASVDDATQTVLVKTPLDPRSGQFRSEQSVRAQVLFDTKLGLTVPVAAVTRINGHYFIFVVESGERGTVASQRPVTLGDVVGGEYVVVEGLTAGDRLIVGGIQKIGDGAPVTAMPPGPPGAGGEGRGGAVAPTGDGGER